MDYKGKNLFCKIEDFVNEASVESLFVERLLKELNYPDGKIARKESIKKMAIARGSIKENYRPDYVLHNANNEPIIVIDAKSPSEKPEDYHYQVSQYALLLNQTYDDKDPILYVAITNGHFFIVWPWNNINPVFFLRFEDFNLDNEKYLELRSNFSYSAFKQVAITKDVFRFVKPELTILTKTFNDLHNLIRDKDHLLPTKAFYELSKIMFIKLKEDDNIHRLINEGKKPTKEDFVFSTDWIDTQLRVEPNPVDSILFRKIQDKLEKEIQTKNKKRIFEKGEKLNLSPSTIYEVVKMLQNYDLYGIDEDLNGRMFETFLNATVRGRELGQFFTPRGVVHYMVETSPIMISIDKKKAKVENIPFILDGCCGSGGFLIDAMAQIIKQIDNMTQLTNIQKKEYKNELISGHLFGVDANPEISRISRLNMYLHGDGGSKIFNTNFLDKDFVLEEGQSDEQKEGIEELKNHLLNENLKFDIVLSNPPFSIHYKSNDANRKRILEKYEIAKTDAGQIATSEDSNVLFLERYQECLKAETGELLTVIDDTVLNGEKSQKHRDYILKNFIVIQIISLPFNTFFRAKANIKTSVIHLRRKKSTEEEQGSIFMAITNNIGHDDHSKDTPDRNNLPTVAKFFHIWQSQGKIETQIINNGHKEEPLGCPLQIFEVSPDKLNKKRLDAFYYSPELQRDRQQLMNLENEGRIQLRKGSTFNVIDIIKKSEAKELSEKVFKYI